MPAALSHVDAYSLSGVDPHSKTQSLDQLPSTTYLPTTTYNPNHNTAEVAQSRTRTPSLTTNVPHLDTFQSQTSNHFDPSKSSSPANPDDFYRQYSQEFESHTPASPNGGGLHQSAIKPLATCNQLQHAGDSNGSYSSQWSTDDVRDRALPPHVPGLKSRKSSVKNLVAQINATSSDETPPIPVPAQQSQPAPTSGYTVRSPAQYLPSSHVSPFGTTTRSRKYSNSAVYAAARSRRSEIHETQRRPLFGEILSSQPTSQSAGYGISNPRRRTASESSPMPNPNPMFGVDQHGNDLSSAGNDQQRLHKRANSDMPVHTDSAYSNSSPALNRRPPVASRIPISTRRASTTSDSGTSASNSRATSALGHNHSSREPSVPRAKTPESRQSLHPPTTPGRITSPGRRGKTPNSTTPSLPSNLKGSHLRANIIAPPPKISPPLRSSRPRLPVSAASTAASRARMAERFNNLQKLNSEKRTSSSQRRAKPPELTDIDLNARRLRITQALTRSRESDEMKSRLATGKRWEPSSRTVSPSPSQRDSALVEESEREKATQGALAALQAGTQGQSSGTESPTLGHNHLSAQRPSVHLQTQFLAPQNQIDEPMSAVTVASEATHIDPEPQDEHSVDAPSLLNHVMHIRAASSSSDQPAELEDHEDRADVESVNLVFRNTAYLDQEEAREKGYAAEYASSTPALPASAHPPQSERDSWTSSLHDEGNGEEDDYFHSSPRPGNYASHALEQHPQDSRAKHSSYRDTMASDAYTIMNIVLQEHSELGTTDQQHADDIYQKVLESCPELAMKSTLKKCFCRS